MNKSDQSRYREITTTAPFLLTAVFIVLGAAAICAAQSSKADESLITEGTFKGTLHAGKTDSYMVYVGEESGDFAAFCFANDSQAGRAMLAACKDGATCEFAGKVDQGIECKVDKETQKILSASGRILSVKSVKSLFPASTGTAKKTPAVSNTASAPDFIVKSLYEAQKADKGPFFQTKNRAIVDKYFTKELADLIWKDAVNANGEVGAIDFDPLYGSQDPRITKFTIMKTGWGGDSRFGSDDQAVVQVTFKDSGKERMVSFQFKQGRDKNWKIYDVHYRGDGDEVRLAKVLTNAAAAAAPSAKNTAPTVTGGEKVKNIRGELQVGKTESVILYLGAESGDYAAYCFTNGSAQGRAIMAACKNGEQCEFSGDVDYESGCKVPGLEADLSASARILKVDSVKSPGRKPGSQARAQEQPHTPAAQTPERKAITDALRVPVQKKLKKSVVFKIDHLKVQGGWAFLRGVPQLPNGKPMDYSDTSYRRQKELGMFDDQISALLKKEGEKWVVVVYDIGATDVVYLNWAEKYKAPPSIFE
ncbi:MAG TPA: DUF3828 domain-containing protein [Pyrinomonadaceae bacterium]|nr:DUF3828 domain-containing protein [Pyrinomonadaceae bacterium]